MSDKDASKDVPDEEEDWMSYANAGFGSTDYSLWDDAGEEAELSKIQTGMMRTSNSILEKKKSLLLQNLLV